MSSDPVKEAEDFAHDPWRDVQHLVQEDIPAEVFGTPREGSYSETKIDNPQLPQRGEIIAQVLAEQLDTIERRKKNQSITTSPLGAEDTPLASSILFGL